LTQRLQMEPPAGGRRERPILFSGPMVRALLAGRKTQTRRVLRPQPPTVEDVVTRTGTDFGFYNPATYHEPFLGQSSFKPTTWSVTGPCGVVRDLVGQSDWECPYGAPGDRLWVRETTCRTDWKPGTSGKPADPLDGTVRAYRADYREDELFPAPWEPEWIPSIHMPRWASRILLEVTEVRVERLQDLSVADAVAEGSCTRHPEGVFHLLGEGLLGDARQCFREAWDGLNARRGFGWQANPYVWAITVRRLSP
jgi:hypothetical protein